ncbi:ArpU family phage packaging/lysis transcriptional regulator [Streptococcus acidominimus]|uniref:ArpU family transcriptional regulator n=1 Tax=Streptococcus acidominimus TaxID=1326 RepID=A0A1Q8EF52_STRAI|nr:ArpU family phage packaging/lysis transcriptional regulator [Streptococcus acidominimus]OLF50419.1 ArpU family transcriptional regulator [Streptococcus acidominimus]SUN06333.1 autolysin regulatory protein [Streptococcus acidominimus]
MTFFPEIDEKQTIRNAKKKLREYPRWRRIAGDVDGQKMTATYSFEPRQSHGVPNRPVERLAIAKVDALAELEAIEYAIGHLFDPNHRRILYEKFLSSSRKRDFEIYNDLFMSEGSYYHALSIALIEFAEVYRNGQLLVENADST